MRPHDTANRVVRIPLHSRKYPGLYAIVDEADTDLVSGHRWYPKPGRNGTFYAIAFPGGRAVYMHQLVVGDTDKPLVDHEDHDGLNNRRSNLRPATNQQNMHNRKRKGASGYTGVSWSKNSSVRPWKAYIGLNGKPVYLGRFATEVEAARAYDRAAIEHFGEFASVNFPDLAPSYVNERQGG